MSLADDIAKLILDRAATVPGDVWDKIRQGAKLYTAGYSQNLIDIAQALKDGDITADAAKLNVENAELLLAMGLAHTQQVTLSAVQDILDGVIARIKGLINRKLPLALL